MAVAMKNDKAKDSFCFQEVKKYTGYLLNQRLEEVAQENLRMLREYQLPILKFFEHLPEEALLTLTRHSIKEFFVDIEQDRSLANAIVALIRWRDNELPGIPRERVEGADLVLAYSIRKQLFLKFLPDYTSDCHLIVTIMQELEQFHIALERQAFELFVDIQKEELNKKNEFLSSLILNSEDAIMAFDTELRLTEWNPVSEALFGQSKEAIKGKKLTEAYPRLNNSEYLQSIRLALQGKRVQMLRQPYVYREGWYDAIVVPLYNSQSNISGALSVVRDATEAVDQDEKIKEHQEELLASNEELQESLTQLEETQEILRTAVEQLEEAQAIAQLGNWEYDVSRNLIFWSKEMRSIFGVNQQDLDLSYEMYFELVHHDDRERLAKAIAETLENYQPYSIEHRIYRKDGAIRWILGQGKVTLTPDSKLQKLTGTAIDITQRKVAELKVLEEQHFIQKVTDTSPDIITVFDLEKRVNIYGNRELYNVLGFTAEEVEEFRKTKGSQWVYSLLHPEDLPRFFAFIEGLRTYTGKEAREIEYRGKNKEGNYLWVLGRYNVFKRNEGGQAVQIIGITRDITDRKKAEQLIQQNEAYLRELNARLEEQVNTRTVELTRKNGQLTRINADLDNFIYTASHDLKAPIANLEGLLTLLSPKIKVSLTEREQELLEMMHKSVGRFKKTIKDLTDIAQMQKELEEETAETVLLGPLLQDIQDDLSHLVVQTHARITIQLEVEQFGYNRKNLRSVLHNLITNAIKYHHPERSPEISISIGRLDDFVLLQVQDNGQGIPEKQHEKIFSLFKRLHKDIEGSGMGLYIVKRIIENSGGRIEVKSEVGQGSVFNLYLKDQAVHEN